MLTKDFYTTFTPGRTEDPGQPYSKDCPPPPPPFVPGGVGGGGSSGGGGCTMIPIYGSCEGGSGPTESGATQCIIGYLQDCAPSSGGGSGGGGSIIVPSSPPPPPPTAPAPVAATKLLYKPRTVLPLSSGAFGSPDPTIVPYVRYVYCKSTSSNMRQAGSAYAADASYDYFYYVLPKASIQAASAIAAAGGQLMTFSLSFGTTADGGLAPTATPYVSGNASAGSLGLLALMTLEPSSTVSQSTYQLLQNNFAVPTLTLPKWPPNPPYIDDGNVGSSNASKCGVLPIQWPTSTGVRGVFNYSGVGPSQPGSSQIFLSDIHTGAPLIETDRDLVISVCATGFLGARNFWFAAGFNGN